MNFRPVKSLDIERLTFYKHGSPQAQRHKWTWPGFNVNNLPVFLDLESYLLCHNIFPSRADISGKTCRVLWELLFCVPWGRGLSGWTWIWPEIRLTSESMERQLCLLSCGRLLPIRLNTTERQILQQVERFSNISPPSLSATASLRAWWPVTPKSMNSKIYWPPLWILYSPAYVAVGLNAL